MAKRWEVKRRKDHGRHSGGYGDLMERELSVVKVRNEVKVWEEVVE